MLRTLSKIVSYTVLFVSIAVTGAALVGGLHLPFSAADLLVPMIASAGVIVLLHYLEQKRLERAVDHYFWRQEFDAMARKRAKTNSDDSGIWPQHAGA